MNLLAAYIPQDRCHALACGTPLPDRTGGAALFADISGFTPLTEALRLALGPRQGSEALTDQINTTYDALIAQVDAYHGSVIGFAGDAITCWFDAADGPAARRAVACAVGMQRAMSVFAQIVLPGDIHSSLALKVAVACGPARRMVAGDPAIQRLDLLAGATVARVATAEHHAVAGEIVLDAACVADLGAAVSIGAWREDAETGEQFAPLHDLTDVPPTSPWPELPADVLTPEVLRPWLLPAVYAREMAGYGAFLTELRPAVALFLRFSGIDYDTDPDAHTRLDTFVRAVQNILIRDNGALLQVVIGDKGSYLCCAFGAPVAHEDDDRRAVLAALALSHEAAEANGMPPLPIGISVGVMRCGAYGSTRRRTYGILGDEVNLAARLMGLATPGEILVSGHVQAAVVTTIACESRPPVKLKGKAELQSVFRVSGLRQERAVRLHEPTYTLPMVGRADEITQIGQILDRVLTGRGHVLGITAEAGLGKSRLVAEVIRMAYQHGMIGYGGACLSTGTHSPYLVWQMIWRAIFHHDPAASLQQQIRTVEDCVKDWAPERTDAIPLLGPLLGLSVPENDFTQSLEPKDRQGALHALLRDCLTAVTHEVQGTGGGLLIVVEDAHWIDATSADLLADLVQAISMVPVLLVLAYRPFDSDYAWDVRIVEVPNFTHIRLSGLDHAATEQLIRAKLQQFFPTRDGALATELIAELIERTQGNPFYLEELLHYLHDRDIDPRELASLKDTELPDSLHRLILSRLDQLSEQQQVILKTSSVIGRRFLVAWLHGAFPRLVPPTGLTVELAELAERELTPLDTPEPELAYLFKHIVTREVAYESLGAATRAALHEQLASYVEQHAGADADALLDLLAYHYEQSDNLSKKREYLRRAGEAAAARYANAAAVSYLSRALDLAPPDDVRDRYALLLAREQIYALCGEREAQHADLVTLVALSDQWDDHAARTEMALRQARYANIMSDFVMAEHTARAAVGLALGADLPHHAATAYWRLGWALYSQRDYAAAQASLEQSLAMAEALGDTQQLCVTLNALSNVAANQGHYPIAYTYLERSAALARTTEDRRLEGYALTDLASITDEQGQTAIAVSYLDQSLTAMRAIGDRWIEGRAVGNLCFMRHKLGDDGAARAAGERSLALAGEIGDRQQMACTYGNLGLIALGQGDDVGAHTSYQQSLALAEALGDRFLVGLAWRGLGNVALARGDLAAAAQDFQASAVILREVSSPAMVAEPLAGLARVTLAQGDAPGALALVEEILTHLEGGTLDGAEEPMRVYLACHQALRANDDPRAPALLARARTELLTYAEQIADPNARKNFLEQVAAHRELLVDSR